MSESITSENKIIKMLKYLFEKDSEALKNILNKAFNKDIKTIELRKISDSYSISKNDRIDLYINLNLDGINSNVFMELSTNLERTNFDFKKYYDLINKAYPTTPNYLIYLKPKYNKTNNEPFKSIYYEKIIKSITINNDSYINTFKDIIHEHLISKRDEEIDKYLLDNIDEIFKKIVDMNKKATDYFKNDLAYKIKVFINYDNFIFDSSNYSLKLYDSFWHNSYVELITLSTNGSIIIQRVIDNEIKEKEVVYVYSPFLSDKWREDLFDNTIIILKNMYNKQKKELNKEQ